VRNGDEVENDVEDYEQICEIRRIACLIGLGRPRIREITHRIGTRTCHIGDGRLTRTRNSIKSQFLMMISPVPAHLSLSCPHFDHHLRIRSYVIPLYLSMP
jgi:dissimilatory sulfite reductase (desulfoviridin) alpha/beta subunit